MMYSSMLDCLSSLYVAFFIDPNRKALSFFLSTFVPQSYIHFCILCTFLPRRYFDKYFQQESGSESEAEDSGSEESGSEKGEVSERGPASPASEGDEEQEDQEWARSNLPELASANSSIYCSFLFRFQRGVNKREKALSGEPRWLQTTKMNSKNTKCQTKILNRQISGLPLCALSLLHR